MKRLLIAMIVTSAALASPAQAQGIQGMGILALDPVDEGNTVLTLQGKSQVARQADVAIFNAGVTTVGATAEEALRNNAREMTQVLAAARALGIADRDIQTSTVSISPVMSDDRRQPRQFRLQLPDSPAAAAAEAAAMDTMIAMEEQDAESRDKEPRIVGYRASNAVSIRQRELEEYGKTIDALVAAGANMVEGPAFSLENSASTEDEARVLAIADARRRAELYAGAAGMRIVRIIMIDEGRTTGLSSGAPGNRFGFWEAGASADYYETPTSSGELTIGGNVGVMFELTPGR